MPEAGPLDRLARRVENYRFITHVGEQGRVSSLGDGIAWVQGLPSAAVEEILHFEEEAGRMKLDYLQFLELEVFTRFGSKLQADAEAKIRRGRLLREILKQDRLTPCSPAFHLAWLIAYNEGLLDDREPGTLPAALGRIQEGLTREPLALDADRTKWLVRLRGWLGDAAS